MKKKKYTVKMLNLKQLYFMYFFGFSLGIIFFKMSYNVIRLAEVAKKQALIFDFAKTLQTQKQL
jgi:hypothetical protein